MFYKPKHIALSIFLLSLVTATNANAQSKLNSEMTAYLEDLASETRTADKSFSGFSVAEGKKLFYTERMHSKKNVMRSCTTCHTKDRTARGRTPVGKKIEPISPHITTDRFTESKKVKKWFRRNCKWVLERECTTREKGNYLTFMFSND